MKICKLCQKKKMDELFYRKKAGYLSSKCKGCYSADSKKEYKKKSSVRGYMQAPIMSYQKAKELYEQVYG